MAVRISAVELVRAAMTATGSATPTELAKALRLEGYSAPRNVKRWLEGDNDPDFDSTLLLLDAAGMLTTSNANVALETGARRALDRRELAAAIHEIADVLDRLRSLAGEQEQPQPGRRQGSA